MNFKFILLTMILIVNLSTYAIKLPDGTDVSIKKIEKYENGSIKSVSLSEPATLKTPIGLLTFFQTVSEFEGFGGNSTIEFHQNGTIKSGHLKDKTIINTKYGKIPVTSISFYEDGKINSFYTPLEYNMVVQGRDVYRVPKTPVYIATSYGNIPVDGTVNFYNSGVINRIDLGNNLSAELNIEKFGKIKLKRYIEFYENSKLSSAEIDNLFSIQTDFGKLKAKNKISLWSNGNIKSVDFEPQVIETPVGLLTVESIMTYESGKLEQFSTSERNQSISFNNQNYELDYQSYTPSTVTLYESGKLKSAMLNEYDKSLINTSLGNIGVGGKLRFYENGNLQYAEKYFDEKVNTKVGTLFFNKIFFYESGAFEGGFLKGYENRINNNQVYEVYFKFDTEGQIIGIVDFDEESESLLDNVDIVIKDVITSNDLYHIKNKFNYYFRYITDVDSILLENKSIPFIIYLAQNGNEETVSYFLSTYKFQDKYYLLNDNTSEIQSTITNISYPIGANYHLLSTHFSEIKNKKIAEEKRIEQENLQRQQEEEQLKKYEEEQAILMKKQEEKAKKAEKLQKVRGIFGF